MRPLNKPVMLFHPMMPEMLESDSGFGVGTLCEYCYTNLCKFNSVSSGEDFVCHMHECGTVM